MHRGYANLREWRRGGEAVVSLRIVHLVYARQVWEFSRALPVRVATPEVPAVPRQAVRQVAPEERALLGKTTAMAVPRHQERARV
jgi:hypothetical protein